MTQSDLNRQTDVYTSDQMKLIDDKLSAFAEALLDTPGLPGTTPGRAKKVFAMKLDTVRQILMHPHGHRYELARGPLTYNEDILATRANVAALEDPAFQEAYAIGRAVSSWGREIRWRAYVVCWAAAQAARLDGDFVECGVDRGGYSRALMHYIDFNNTGKTMYLLDTFCGMVEEQFTGYERDIRVVRADRYEECYESVVNTFAAFPNVKIIRGPIPETLEQVDAHRVAYLSIDMNCAAPEIAAGEYFWDRLVPGGIVVLDDYAFRRHEEQHDAWDRFAEERSARVLTLPTGQGMLIKPPNR